MQTKQENQLEINNSIGTAGYARTVGEDGKSYRTGISSLVSGAIGDDIEQLENDVEALQTAVGEHTTDIQNNSNDISDLQTLTSGHTTSIGNLQTAVGTNTEDITDLKEDFEALETQLDETTTLALAALPQETIENVAIASFDDGADGVPVKELKIAIEPIQSGSGDPSPTNVRPISGRDSVTVTRTGVNVWDEEWEVGGLSSATGENWNTSDRIRSKNYIAIKPNTSIYIQYPTSGINTVICFYDADKGFISGTLGIQEAITPPQNAYFMRFATYSQYGTTYNNDISINYPSTDHDYHSGADNTSYPIPLSSTIYGGTLEVETGVLTVDRVMVDLGTLNWAKSSNGNKFYATLSISFVSYDMDLSMICSDFKFDGFGIAGDRGYYGDNGTIRYAYSNISEIYVHDERYSDATSFKTAMDGVQLVYPVATPTTVQLTPTQVTTLLNDNNIFADSGDVKKLIYRADLGAYIEKLINA